MDPSFDDKMNSFLILLSEGFQKEEKKKDEKRTYEGVKVGWSVKASEKVSKCEEGI